MDATLYPALIFDTETTGLFKYRDDDGNSVAADAPGQPRMCAIAGALVMDETADPLIFTTLIKPDGWTIGEEAAAKNGLTLERLEAEGVPVDVALDGFLGLYAQAPVLAAFGIIFDTKVLRAEFRRAGLPDRFGEKYEVCVQKVARPLCNLPSKKIPTLTEAVRELLGEDHPDAHDATADMLKTVALYRHLAGLGHIVPKVREGSKQAA